MMTETKLVAAAVYRNGCIMKRNGSVKLEAGTQKVYFGGLSANVDESSLRLSVPDNLSGGNVQLEYPTREQQTEALKELNAQLSALKEQIQRLEKLAALWEANADFSQKASLSVQEMSDYLEKLPERLAAINAELTGLKVQKAELDKAFAEAKRKAALPFVSAELKADAAGEYPVELTYRDYQAFWNPVYEIHAENETDALKLRLRAKIMQNSGEDWKGVSLTLFTGNPAVSGTIPELLPSHIRFYTPRPARRFGATAAYGGMMKAAVAMEDTAEMADMEEAEAVMAAPMQMNAVMNGMGTASKGETMTEYALSGVWDIRSGQEILCDIHTDEIACRYHVVAVPKLSEEAYLAAEVATADLEDLQGTPAAVYLGGTFAGNVILNPDMTKDTYDLSLGVDETVRVKRQQKKRHTANVLLKGQKKTEYEYEITVSSRKDKEISVTVTDQIPVSEEKSIIVEALQLSAAEREEDTGLLHWNFALAAGETKNISFAYTVAWPKDKLTEEGV